MKYLQTFENRKRAYNPSKTIFDISGEKLFDISKYLPFPDSLRTVNISDNNLQKLPDLSGLPNITTLNCSKNNLKELTNLPNSIKSIECELNDKLTYIDKLPEELVYLKISHTKITKLPTLPKYLSEIKAQCCKLESFPEDLPNDYITLWLGFNNWKNPLSQKIMNKCKDRDYIYTYEQIERFKSYEFQKSFMEETPFEWKDLDVRELGIHPKIKKEFEFIFNYDSYKLD